MNVKGHSSSRRYAVKASVDTDTYKTTHTHKTQVHWQLTHKTRTQNNVRTKTEKMLQVDLNVTT